MGRLAALLEFVDHFIVNINGEVSKRSVYRGRTAKGANAMENLILLFIIAMCAFYLSAKLQPNRRDTYTVDDIDKRISATLQNLRRSYPHYVILDVTQPESVIIQFDTNERGRVFLNRDAHVVGFYTNRHLGVFVDGWWHIQKVGYR